MNIRDLNYRIKDLEAEFDYYCLYEPDDRKSMDKLKREIDDAYHQIDMAIKAKKEKEAFRDDN
tara:strand:+ start:111 stop:299 length:189 start_codon:yes stop_codon:yes gene_type:complete